MPSRKALLGPAIDDGDAQRFQHLAILTEEGEVNVALGWAESVKVIDTTEDHEIVPVIVGADVAHLVDLGV